MQTTTTTRTYDAEEGRIRRASDTRRTLVDETVTVTRNDDGTTTRTRTTTERTEVVPCGCCGSTDYNHNVGLCFSDP